MNPEPGPDSKFSPKTVSDPKPIYSNSQPGNLSETRKNRGNKLKKIDFRFISVFIEIFKFNLISEKTPPAKADVFVLRKTVTLKFFS